MADSRAVATPEKHANIKVLRFASPLFSCGHTGRVFILLGLLMNVSVLSFQLKPLCHLHPHLESSKEAEIISITVAVG